MQFGISVHEMTKPLDVKATVVTDVPMPAGGVAGTGPLAAFSRADTRSFTAANARTLPPKARSPPRAMTSRLEERHFPKARFLSRRPASRAGRLSDIAAKTGVAMTAGTAKVATEPVRPARLGLYKSWAASMDEGWMRLIFEEHGIPFTTITDTDVRAGSLRDRFDVIIVPDQSADAIVKGQRAEEVPLEYAGGITEAGVANLKAFAEAGGVLVFNGAACTMAIDRFALPVDSIANGLTPDQFFIPGSI